jgi:hypothetical protein
MFTLAINRMQMYTEVERRVKTRENHGAPDGYGKLDGRLVFEHF